MKHHSKKQREPIDIFKKISDRKNHRSLKVNSKKRFLILFVIFLFNGFLYGEMPEPPNYEELCEQSELVVLAFLVNINSEKMAFEKPINPTMGSVNYYVHTFQIEKTYEGNIEDKIIQVSIPKDYNIDHTIIGCPIFPKYKKGLKYLLFLNRIPSSPLYIRTEIDDIWNEKLWKEKLWKEKDEKYVLEELAFLSDSHRWQNRGDNLDYGIPSDANEIVVELTDFQKVNGYSKRSEFYVKGELVGEKAWYKNGRLAYDAPVKNGLRHGIHKAWNRDGNLIESRPYRKNRLHGVLIRYRRGEIKEKTYWIRGENVSKEKYEDEMKVNKSLPTDQ